MKKSLCFIFALCLFGCDTQNSNQQNQEPPTTTQNAQTDSSTANNPHAEDNTPATPTIGADGLIHIDLDKLNTGIKPTDSTTYPYPFALDSEPVKNYATEYNITPQQAQLAMTLSMASPEALNKVLDQIVGEYVGHSLTDGANMSLVVYTSDKVAPSEFDYVIADKFGEGLVLPVKIMPASQTKDKPQVDIKSVSDKFAKDDGDDGTGEQK